MPAYKHAVGTALDKELTKMFVTYQALVLINKSDIPPGCLPEPYGSDIPTPQRPS